MWDYSISQATLETIFMSFAKNQEEETASVPGVSYTDTANRNDADRNTNDSNGDTHAGGLRYRQQHPPAPSMDVEMGRVENQRRR